MEDITTIVIKNKNKDIKPIKIKECDMESYDNHIIYEWVEEFYDGTKIPLWVTQSITTIEFEFIHK